MRDLGLHFIWLLFLWRAHGASCLMHRAAITETSKSSPAVNATAWQTRNSSNKSSGSLSQIEKKSSFQISFVNNGFGAGLNAYITGKDSQNRLVMVDDGGDYFYPTAPGNKSSRTQIQPSVAIALGGRGTTTNVTMPSCLSSSRVWVSEGMLSFDVVSDPSTRAVALVEPSVLDAGGRNMDVNWGFVELSYRESDGLFADISFVDFVGLPLGISLLSQDGSLQTASGVRTDAVQRICESLRAQAARDGQPWDHLCQVDSHGSLLRVIAPSNLLASNNSAFAGYYQSYIDAVWDRYAREPLMIDTQSGAGVVACQVRSELLTCDGVARPFPKPTCQDIFGCDSGPFSTRDGDDSIYRAVVPRLCAAFVRSTLTLENGNMQPGAASDYYQMEPTDWYSALVHQNEYDGRGYAFPYDDVTPQGGKDQSGTLSSVLPETLTIFVGGPDSHVSRDP